MYILLILLFDPMTDIQMNNAYEQETYILLVIQMDNDYE
jgi:hypothetical protein